jgi:hypothetical protein
MNVEIGTEAAQFLEKEYINDIFLAVYTMPSFLPQWYNTVAAATNHNITVCMQN